MNTFDSIGKQLYQIIRDNGDPKRVKVLFDRPDPLLATKALSEILNGLGSTYKGVKTAEFLPADGSDADRVWAQHHMGNLIYTGILLTHDVSIEPKIYDDDVLTHHVLPDAVRRRIISRYCRVTHLDRMDVFLSESIVHLPRMIKDYAVYGDYQHQAVAYFTVGNDTPMLDRYAEQHMRGKTFIMSMFATAMSARLSIDREVDILRVRQFLTAARQDFVKCNPLRPGTTDDTIWSACKLFDAYPGTSFGFADNYAMTRGEALTVYQRELDNYRGAEARWLDHSPLEEFDVNKDERNNFLLP